MSHWPPARLDQAPIVQEMPVQSLVCNPPQNSVVGMKNATDITIKGVAWSGGGREIQRVDVSIDGGKNWLPAELYKPIQQGWNRHWAWTQFYQTITLPDDIQTKLKNGEKVQLDLVSKALNSDFNVQPERMEPYWNAAVPVVGKNRIAWNAGSGHGLYLSNAANLCHLSPCKATADAHSRNNGET